MGEETIFAEALSRKNRAQRSAYLDAACGGDTSLRRRVEALIDSHEGAGSFLAEPAVHAPAADSDASGMGETQSAGSEPRGDDLPLDFLRPSADPAHLGRFGEFEILEEVGRGGMGIVFKAYQEDLHRVVAVKVMAPQLATNATARRRFNREAKAAGAVSHDHIVTIHEVDEKNGLPYIVMQFVAGESLQDRLDRVGPLDVGEVLRIGIQTASGLAAAHTNGLVHRDIKPANILLENGIARVKITDFGLARSVDDASVTQSGVIAGTPMYMSPEQAMGEAVDHRTDLFSLGSVMYAMCTGHPPFRASGTMAVLKRVIDDTPRPIHETNPEVPDWLCDIIAKLQAKRPGDRFQTAKDVADLLEQHLANLQQPSQVAMPAPIQPPPASSRPPSRRRSRALPVLLIGLPFLLALPAVSLAVILDMWVGIFFLVFVLLPLSAISILIGIILLVARGKSPPETVAAKPEPRPARPARKGRKRFLTALAVLAAVGAAAWFGPPLLGMARGTGVVRFEANDSGLAVQLKLQGRIVAQSDLQRAGWHRLPPGQYRVEVIPRNSAKPIRKLSLDYPNRWLPATIHVDCGPVRECQIDVRAGGTVVVKIEVGTDLPPPPPPESLPPLTDMDKLQGAWVAVTAEQLGRPLPAERLKDLSLVFANRSVRVAWPGFQTTNGAYKLDSTSDPKGIAFVPRDDKGVFGIYRLDSDRLTVCMGAPSDRPEKFGTTPNTQARILATFRRTARAEDGFIPLFNRVDMTGWKYHHSQAGNWTVEDGVLVGRPRDGKPNHLFSDRGDFQDFHLRAEVQIDQAGNSGIYFRSPFELRFLGGVYPPAYELQIYNNEGPTSYDDYKTGSIHSIVKYPKVLVKSPTWFTIDLEVHGQHVTVRVNGITTVDANLALDQHRKEPRGHIALQIEKGIVRFRKVEIKEPPPPKAAESPK